MADRQWFAEGLGIHEEGEREYFAEGVGVRDDQADVPTGFIPYPHVPGMTGGIAI